MLFATIVFLVSLAGIILLFGLKYWENRRTRVVAPLLREQLDTQAIHLKELMHAARADLGKVPPEVLRLSRIGVHKAALGLAALALMAEYRAHRVADLVSYKHRFEKRETQSEFLKKVSEHKNGNGNGSGLDTTE